MLRLEHGNWLTGLDTDDLRANDQWFLWNMMHDKRNALDDELDDITTVSAESRNKVCVTDEY